MVFTVKHKVPTLIVRLLLAVFFVLSGGMMLIVTLTGGLGNLSGTGGAGLPEDVSAFISAVIETGYLWTWLGVFKLVTGVLLLVPRTNPLGVMAAFPYAVNIFLYVLFLAPVFALLGAPLFLASCYLIYAYWDYYKPIVAPVLGDRGQA